MDSKAYARFGAISAVGKPTHFQVWAPKVRSMTVQLVPGEPESSITAAEYDLERDREGVFTGQFANCLPGTLYRFRLDERRCLPDPRSRFQPQGVHGPSEIVDSSSYNWTDGQWTGVNKRDLVVYEMHVGSYSDIGTYQSAIPKLAELVDLGITAVELLPLAQSPGKWNWGYDGVNLFAPRNTYGRPDDLKHFVNCCHNLGLAVILDVVYNHVGPEGNYLNEFGPYASRRHRTPWGDSFNFDARRVREFVTDNVVYWIDEFHFDGLRLDAVHFLFDDHEKHILAEIETVFRQYQSITNRKLHLIAETNVFDSELLGKDLADAIWSDCMMHSIYRIGAPDIQLTDRKYLAGDLSQILEYGYVFCTPQATRANAAIRAKNHLEPGRRFVESLIIGLQTHDAVGNHPEGQRIHQLTSRQFQKAASSLVLLYPSIPLIFMGEEWATQAPFPFFADFESPELRSAVDNGRRAEYPDKDWSESVLPSDPQAFHRTKSSSGQLDADMYAWYQRLLLLRQQGIAAGWLDIDCLTSSSNPQSHVYRLTYIRHDVEMHVCVCLATGNRLQPKHFDELGVGDVILDSRPGSNRLQTEHALIWSSSAAGRTSME